MAVGLGLTGRVSADHSALVVREKFTPLLDFGPEVRRVSYTTNAIESLNYQLRKIIKNRGHFPNGDAVVNLLWLAILDIGDKRARERARQKGLPKNHCKQPSWKLVEGAAEPRRQAGR